ncbi:hypothetical protein [Xanthobacter autotrophicus]|uniref:hypothetical protein n=1 Tax=Xanthobacter autotrophicus TaxID=280 RepID=UPI00372947BB
MGGLKDWLHRELQVRDKLLLVLATFEQPVKVVDVRSRAEEAGFRIPKKWNISDVLGRSGGLAIRVPLGWELTDTGKNHLRNLGVTSVSPAAMQVAADLRQHLAKVKNSTTHAFVEEAIKCHEAKLYRAAVVMSWIAAVDVLYRDVVANHLAAFNVEAKNFNAKWKPAVNEDGLARMGEADFLDRLVPIGVIGKNVKEELAKALKLRNGCGHPNSLKIGQNMVASHLEILLLNVFEPFSA